MELQYDLLYMNQELETETLTFYVVLLLDEADTFMQQRSLSEMGRNAIVSGMIPPCIAWLLLRQNIVFLRAIEFYTGTMFLTTNRVGVFDEAFISRIQVALHYAHLTKNKRIVIWENLINRFCSKDDTSDIIADLDELAEHQLNGRQIRNVLLVAIQTAQYDDMRLCRRHLDHAIRQHTQFERYLGATGQRI